METEQEALEALEELDTTGGIDSNSKKPPMSVGELVGVLDSELQQGYGDDDSELSLDRAKGLDYYFNRPRGDEVTGRSKVQTSDVMDVIEWLKPDIIEAFTTNEDAVQFLPKNKDDVEQARMESRYINHIFHTEAGGYLTLHDMVVDALLSKNGIVKTVRQEKVKIKYVEYEGLTSVELQSIVEGDSETNVEVYEQESRDVSISEFDPKSHTQVTALPEVQEQIQSFQQQIEQGIQEQLAELGYNPAFLPQELQADIQQQREQRLQEAMAEIVVPLYDVKIKVQMVERKSCCINVPPEDFRINEDHPSVDVSEARFTAHVVDFTESDLIELGIDAEIVQRLPTSSKIVNEESHQRQYHTLDPTRGSFLDRTTRNIEGEDCWVKVDFDGDGMSELRHVLKVGNEILINEYADENPFSCISPIMIPHRWVGVSIHDRIKQIQDIGTAVWRQLLDNLYQSNNNKTIVVENQVNMDDMLSPRAAGVIRTKRLDAVQPFPHTPLSPESYGLMDRLARVRMERSGVGPEMMAEGMVIDNDTAHGVERLMASKEKLVGMIIRNFAETGISDIFKKLHNLEIKYQNKPKQAQINGQWLTVNPKTWSWRTQTVIKVGLGAGDKIRHAAVMAKILMNHTSLTQAGKAGVLVNDVSVFNALCDELRFSGIRNPEQYYLDPRSPESLEAQEELAAKAEEMPLEDKIITLESQIKQMDAQLRLQKQQQDFLIKQDEQQRKRSKDAVEGAQGWEDLDIERDKLNDRTN